MTLSLVLRLTLLLVVLTYWNFTGKGIGRKSEKTNIQEVYWINGKNGLLDII